jgi:hypothetical protein
MKEYSLSPKYEIFCNFTEPKALAYIVGHDSDSGCVCLQDADRTRVKLYIPPDMALLVAEAMIKMAEHIKNK